MSFCGLRKPRPLRRRKEDKGKGKEDPGRPDVRDWHDSEVEVESESKGFLHHQQPYPERKDSANFDWAREDQLSTILENLDENRRSTPNWEHEPNAKWDRPAPAPAFVPKFATAAFKKTRFLEHVERSIPEDRIPLMSFSGRKTPETPRPIAPPPKDLESIARIDKSLIFEHFTTNDAWELGSALRNRLLPLSTPVVIDISLANQNQILFRTCTHSGVMPDNDNWVARKRKTVLRWGCSTWYMHCKFNGDEIAFREKFGLGNSAGEYAIHGGGVPIRVTGVEGVVAVVVVSGLKQDEDHGVIVEVIRELYY